MSTIKRRKVGSASLPLDCWGQIVSYFQKSSEVIGILLVVKGLYDYLKNILPQCTKNTTFFMKTKFPSNDQFHVTNLAVTRKKMISKLNPLFVPPREPLDVFFKGLSVEGGMDLINKIGQKFPNLSHLDVVLETCYTDPKLKLEQAKTIKIDLSFTEPYFRNLVHLELDLPPSVVKLSHELPMLQTLNLFNVRCPSKVKKSDPTNLFIDWKMVPSLKNLFLFGWRMETRIADSVLKSLESIMISHTFSEPFSFDRLECVKNIRIEEETISVVSKISHLPNLTKLRVSACGALFSDIYRVDENLDAHDTRLKNVFHFRFELRGEHFKNLKVLEVLGKKMRFVIYKNAKDKINIRNFPCLETLVLEYVLNPILVRNTPKLCFLRSFTSGTIEFPRPLLDGKNLKTLILIWDGKELEFGNYPSIHNKYLFPIEIIRHFKKLQNIEFDEIICGDVHPLSLVDYPDLISFTCVSCEEFDVLEIKNCPKLETVVFDNPSEKFTLSSNFPVMELMEVAGVHSIAHAKSLLNQIRVKVPKLTCLALSLNARDLNDLRHIAIDDNLVLKPDLFSSNLKQLHVNHFKHVIFDGEEDKNKLEHLNVRGISCQLSNFSNLKSIRYDFPKSLGPRVLIKKCKGLEKLTIISTGDYHGLSFLQKSYIDLVDVSDCKDCEISEIGMNCEIRTENFFPVNMKITHKEELRVRPRERFDFDFGD